MLPLGQAGGKDGSLGHPKTKRLAKRQKKIVKKRKRHIVAQTPDSPVFHRIIKEYLRKNYVRNPT
tara:strand:+ start:353 stop:547 length:195 start_codon:yes stop_codon:yes gene_type:complete